MTFAVVYSNLKHCEADGALKVLRALKLILFSLVLRARIQTKSAVKCLDLILTNAEFAANFLTFKTNIHLHVDELPTAATLVVYVGNLRRCQIISSMFHYLHRLLLGSWDHRVQLAILLLSLHLCAPIFLIIYTIF